MEQYLKEHQLTPEVIERWGIKVSHNALSIPILDDTGINTLFWKTRHLTGNAKYTYTKGATASLFGSHLIKPETDQIFIVEGELKAIAMNDEQRFPNNTVAISSTGGSKTWKDEWSEYLSGKDVIILYDNDEPGMEGAMMLWYKLCLSKKPQSITVATTLDGYKDINEWYMDNQRTEIEIMIPKSLSLLGLNDKKRNNMKQIRTLLENANDFELLLTTNNGRNYLSLWREYVHKEYKNNVIKRKNKEAAIDIPEYATENLYNIKKIPISNFIKFNNGLAPCLWHSDRNPSLHYNGPYSSFPNTVKCFSCGKFADVIDVVMAQQNVDFKNAINYLKTL